ncbi:MAG: hypothetical protein MRY57_03425 [Candidatus Pacebacteria bacterium]|nr:hypothetical protein [Candidatus Paceibacterota bacterium]
MSFSLPVFAQNAAPLASKLMTTGQLTVGKVAPGEDLPLQVQLINFGTPEERVDVVLNYSVKDETNKIVLTNTETVAVQTTASFVKNIYIPADFNSGTYTIDLVMAYRDQDFPAISQAQFKIQKKYFGFFLSDWLRAIPFLIIPFIFAFFWGRRKKNVTVLRPNYAHIPEDERTYYEIVHDIITSIHYHVGDREMNRIIKEVPGVTLDTTNMYIEELNGSVGTIIAQLIHEYEIITGKKANVIMQANYQHNRVRSH